MANELIADNDVDEDSPLLYTSAVLRTAKWQDGVQNCIHKDPWTALHLLYSQEMPHEIHYYCAAPFFIQWCLKHQLTVYRKLTQQEHVCLAIDASGRFVRPLTLPDKSSTGPIYLYTIVAKNSTGQVPIAQMLSARHTAIAIEFWLSAWRENGALPIPKEVVTDGSLALLGVCVRAFTREKTVNEYADLFCEGPPAILPSCYIRLNVAHFLKKYRDLLGKLGSAIRQFYLAALGKLIRCENVKEAERIIQALLTVSQCETDGPQPNGRPSAVQQEKEFLLSLLTDEDYNFELLDESNCNERDGAPEPEIPLPKTKMEPSKWRDWVTKINLNVLRNIQEHPGNPRTPNAFVFPTFAEQIIFDSKHLPLWSCITLEYFGYGRNPASSSHVEGEFKNLRLMFSGRHRLQMRADTFIVDYSAHMNGLTKLTRVKIPQTNIDANPPIPADEIPNNCQREEDIREPEPYLENSSFPGFSENDFATNSRCSSCGEIDQGLQRCAVSIVRVAQSSSEVSS